MPSVVGFAHSDHRTPPALENRIVFRATTTVDARRFSKAQRERTNREACLRPLSAGGRVGGVLSERPSMRSLRGGRRLPAGLDAGAEAEEERSVMKERPSFGRVAVIHDWLTGMRGGEHV